MLSVAGCHQCSHPSAFLVVACLLSEAFLADAEMALISLRGRLGDQLQASPRTLDGDPCFEAGAMSDFYAKASERKQTIADVYRGILATCTSGQYHTVCVAKAQF